MTMEQVSEARPVLRVARGEKRLRWLVAEPEGATTSTYLHGFFFAIQRYATRACSISAQVSP